MAELTNGLKFSLTNGKLTFTITPSFMETREVSLLLLFKKRVTYSEGRSKGGHYLAMENGPLDFHSREGCGCENGTSWTVVRHLSKPEEV